MVTPLSVHNSIKSVGIDIIYPIGALYITVNNIDPSTYLGGVWERFGSGKAIVGVDELDSDFSEAEKSSGVKSISHKHSNSVTGGTAITVAQMPSHTHTFTGTQVASGSSGSHDHSINGWGVQITTSSAQAIYAVCAPFTEHNNVSNTTSYTNSGGGTTNHTHYVTPKGANSNTGSGTAHTHTVSDTESTEMSTLQPYITCYIWKRIA